MVKQNIYFEETTEKGNDGYTARMIYVPKI